MRMVREHKEVRKITLGLILSWLIGLLFLLVAFGTFIAGSFIPGFLYLFAALILLPPVNNFLRKKFNVELSRWLKVVTFLILITLAGYIGSTFKPSSDNTQTTTTTTQQTMQKLITKSLDEMFPTRNDISTEWFTGSSEPLKLEEEGFIEGKRVSYYKTLSDITYAGIDVDFYVRRFSDSNSARIFYEKIINKIKSEGGFKEMHITDCFAFTTDMGREESAESICLKNNIVYGVYVYNDYIWENPDDELKDFTNLLKNKIS